MLIKPTYEIEIINFKKCRKTSQDQAIQLNNLTTLNKTSGKDKYLTVNTTYLYLNLQRY